jgi:threonine/homoserine/homoserine lactone efflux protein
MMPLATVIPLAVFCLVATITPGPNNMMLLSSGATYGFRRTSPHIIGISVGGAIMSTLLGFSIANVASRLPGFYATLHIVSSLYLLWLAWRIARSTGLREVKAGGRPLRVVDAAIFQWVNPKAWAIALGALAGFARPAHLVGDIAVIVLVRTFVGLPSLSLWAGFGLVLKRYLKSPVALRAFNIGMASLLVLSLLPELLEMLPGGPKLPLL